MLQLHIFKLTFLYKTSILQNCDFRIRFVNSDNVRRKDDEKMLKSKQHGKLLLQFWIMGHHSQSYKLKYYGSQHKYVIRLLCWFISGLCATR